MSCAAASTRRTSSGLASTVIDALDHLTIAGSASVYETLLGRRASDGGLQTANVGLRFGAGSAALSSMTFATASLDKAARLLERRAVPSERAGDRLVLSREATHGVPIELRERQEHAAPSPLAGSDEAAGEEGGLSFGAGLRQGWVSALQHDPTLARWFAYAYAGVDPD